MSHAKNSRLFLILLLGSLSAFGPFITDLYLPALPGMGEYFHTSASMVQLTLTTSMIGLGLGQLFIGPISDKYGRIRPLMVSLAIYIASTLLIVFTQDIEGMIVLRAIQGLSSAGSVVLSRAIAADLYQGEELSRFFALLMSVNGIAPIVSPVFGALLLQFTNWRGIFVVLVLIGVVLMAFCLRLEETHPPQKRMTGSLLSIFTVLGKILTNRTFMGFAGIQALIMGVLFAYIASSSFIFQTAYGVGKFAYGLCFGLNGAALVAGAALARKMRVQRALRYGIGGFAAAAVLVALFLIAHAPLWLLETGLFLLLFCMGGVNPGLSALAMSAERQYAGSASAFLGFFGFTLGGAVSPLVGIGNIFYATATAITACALLAAALYWQMRDKA
ncbi:multidrug effflux MFS transporter [Cardiobacterium valvarum]|uniref:Bcr/CflA family efflux transporter n=1 Tax=Cardiobacterium valvarum TaxID=194702 RepID=A0A381EA40_9GAMM|nr:multidrug effflux MFS transporter [Cardiobacterium valvarum]SUX23738.1 Sulfonamide resistance protein [Cardiobacterium valvarum]